MSLAPIFGKYALFLTSLGTSVGVSLFYSGGGSKSGGVNNSLGKNLEPGKKVDIEMGTQQQKVEDLVLKQDIPDLVQPSEVKNSKEISKQSVQNTREVKLESNSQESKNLEVQDEFEKDIPKPKGEEAKKLETDQLNEFLTPFFKTLETPLYYRGYMNFINEVRMTLPKDTIDLPTKYWVHEGSEDGKEKLGFYPNKEKSYPKIMSYTPVEENDKFKELALQSKKWFKDWNKGKSNNSEEYYDFYYEIKKGANKTELIFWKYFKDKWYSFELEYAFDPTYLGPVLQVGYVWYKDTSWWGGAYYQAEGGRGYQRHIGAVGSSWYGNSEALINKDFVSSFESTDISKFSKWWKILSSCAEDTYCKATLEIPKYSPDYVKLPLNHYKDKERDNWYDNFHPLQLKFSEIEKPYKFDSNKLKHINTVRGIQR